MRLLMSYNKYYIVEDFRKKGKMHLLKDGDKKALCGKKCKNTIKDVRNWGYYINIDVKYCEKCGEIYLKERHKK